MDKVRTIIWDMFSGFVNDNCGVYIDVYADDLEDAKPNNILIRCDITNSGAFYGDGRPLYRISECDLSVISRENLGGDEDTATIIQKVEKTLADKGIAYTKLSNLYDHTVGKSVTSFSFIIMVWNNKDDE